MVIFQLHTMHARAELGFTSKIPADATREGVRLSDGLVYRVTAPHGRRGHRVRVNCPLCNNPDIPAGRLHQHIKAHGGAWQHRWISIWRDAAAREQHERAVALLGHSSTSST